MSAPLFTGDNWAEVGQCPCSDSTTAGACHLPSEPCLPTKFQVFLKQINSSLVDSNMLVRCVTLSLDRFENQVDMKGKKRPEHPCKCIQCGLAGVRHPAFSKETRKAGRSPTKHSCGWGQGGGSLGDFLCCFYFPLWFVLPLLSMYNIVIR